MRHSLSNQAQQQPSSLHMLAAGEPNQPLVELRNLSARVTLGNGEKLTTVAGVTLQLQRAMSYAVVGKSGSGKTSLVSIIGMLNKHFEGEYFFAGDLVRGLNDRQLSKLRADKVGFVFQNYSLIKHLKVRENVELALQYLSARKSSKDIRVLAMDALNSVGLADKALELPSKLSGGEQQRVAIARALVTSPELLICDEPTGALDTETGQQILELLHEKVAQKGTTLLLVTHDGEVASSCAHTYRLDSGRLSADV